MKKVLAAALLCAVSSFAAWDYFPTKEAGKGEAKVGLGYSMEDKASDFGIEAKARYSIIEGLEVALFTEFPMSKSEENADGKSESCKEEDGIKCPPTMARPVIGVRYWLPMGLGIALDVAIPLQGKAMDQENKGKASLGFRPAIQFSTDFTPELSLGSEVSLSIEGESESLDMVDANGKKIKNKAGMDLGIGFELDYSLGSVTPYLGADLAVGVTKPQVNGKEEEGAEAEKLGIDVSLGAVFEVNETFDVDVGIIFGFGDRYKVPEYSATTGLPIGEKSVIPITFQARVSYNF